MKYQEEKLAMKKRFVALTDIYRLPDDKQNEIDDVESMIRLLLYADNIDIEGLFATSSFCLHNGGTEKEKKAILDIIDSYEKVLPNLRVHAAGYPDADYLRSVTKYGITGFGYRLGRGFGEEKYNDNEGVKHIIAVVDKDDPRPVWFGLWGGCNTLAQAVWKVWKSRSAEDFDKFIRKIRVYGISDQDKGGRWLRQTFGDRLFYIVSPSSGGSLTLAGAGFVGATWTGMCWDGSTVSKLAKGFEGAETKYISNEWLKSNICGESPYRKQYPLPTVGMEGDTPTYLGLIENGLNDMEHPNYGSWGGRYEFKYPDKYPAFTRKEKYPIWTDANDTIILKDGRSLTNNVCSLYRWRKAVQLDFAARMRWTEASEYKDANHPPVVKLSTPQEITVKPGSKVSLSADGSFDPDGDLLFYKWFNYKEAGNHTQVVKVEDDDKPIASFTAPNIDCTLHFILELTDGGTPALTSYARVIVHVEK